MPFSRLTACRCSTRRRTSRMTSLPIASSVFFLKGDDRGCGQLPPDKEKDNDAAERRERSCASHHERFRQERETQPMLAGGNEDREKRVVRAEELRGAAVEIGAPAGERGLTDDDE